MHGEKMRFKKPTELKWKTNPIHKCTGKQHETKYDEREIIYLSVNYKSDLKLIESVVL